uniref:Putative lipid phosphate phosphatase n=1 Tax=Tabanus bromius TaxID=304241 RepID=A0A0K8TTU9_TABBR
MSSETAASEITPLRSRSGTVCVNNNNYTSDTSNCDRVQINISGDVEDAREMDDNRKIFIKVGIDILILMCVGFPILFFYLWGDPYKRGFYCDDESLRHPFKESTVRNWMLYIVGLALPIFVMIITEIVRANIHKTSTRHRYRLFSFDVPSWAVEAYKQIGVFGFGAACSQLTTDIAKYSIGRLRPHFYSVCEPIMKDGSNCSNPINFGKYIEDFQCIGTNSSPRMLKEMRLSFPSGHSSFSAYTMVYCAIYLHARMKWRGSKLAKHFLQFFLVMLAWYTALSRVSDYKHHWSDVLSGSLLGTVCAVTVANCVADLFNTKAQSVLPLARLDSSVQATNGRP